MARKVIGEDRESAGALLHCRREGVGELGRGAGVHDVELQLQRLRRAVHDVLQIEGGGGVSKEGHAGEPGHDLLEQLEPLGAELRRGREMPGHVPPGSGVGRHEPLRTGSEWFAMTIGIVDVARRAASGAGEPRRGSRRPEARPAPPRRREAGPPCPRNACPRTRCSPLDVAQLPQSLEELLPDRLSEGTLRVGAPGGAESTEHLRRRRRRRGRQRCEEARGRPEPRSPIHYPRGRSARRYSGASHTVSSWLFR